MHQSLAHRGQVVLPLPKGAGRGEGKQRIKLATPSHIAHTPQPGPVPASNFARWPIHQVANGAQTAPCGPMTPLSWNARLLRRVRCARVRHSREMNQRRELADLDFTSARRLKSPGG